MQYLLTVLVTIAVALPLSNSFSPPNILLSNKLYPKSAAAAHHPSTTSLNSGAPSDTAEQYDIPASVGSASERLEDCKQSLFEQCNNHELGSGSSSIVEGKIKELEQLGEDAGYGQASSLSGLISGECETYHMNSSLPQHSKLLQQHQQLSIRELIYASNDITRSSPFFWAFRRAFPDSSDQIFGITDAIPPPIKEVGPATQTINISAQPVTGTLVSRVTVATLGGLATSIMTTRCSVLSVDGLDGLRVKVETTKPEDNTILKKLGPIGEMLNESAPPFPSGETLEQVAPGSSEIVMRTTYCDENIRITRNDDTGRSDEDVFVWKRVKFGSGNTISV